MTDGLLSIRTPVNYYRLKQVDLNGKKNYSQINAVRLKKDSRQLIVSPNPFTNFLNINVEWSRNEFAFIKILNASGKEVSKKSMQFVRGTNYIRVDDLTKLSAGNYFIEIYSSEEKILQAILKL